MHKHTVFLFVILLLIAANVYGQAIDSLQMTHIARTISQETDMFLTESIGESKELCTFVRTIHHTTTSMNLRLILLYCLLMQFLLPTHGQGMAGSNIASRTFLDADGSQQVEQH